MASNRIRHHHIKQSLQLNIQPQPPSAAVVGINPIARPSYHSDSSAPVLSAIPLPSQPLAQAATFIAPALLTSTNINQLSQFMDQVRIAGYGEELAVSIAEAYMPEKKLNANNFIRKGPLWFKSLCAVSLAYIVGDVSIKTVEAYKKAKSETKSNEKAFLYASSVFVDRGLFQGLSTWLLPIYLIKFLANGTRQVVTKLAPSLKGTPTLKTISLLASFLPTEYIAHALDSGTHALLDKTIRPWLGLPSIVTLGQSEEHLPQLKK